MAARTAGIDMNVEISSLSTYVYSESKIKILHFLIITLANVGRFSKYFRWQIHFLCVHHEDIASHLKGVTAFPYQS